jgi:hypothetical protein
MEIGQMRKAIVAAALPLAYAIVQQITGMGDGPTADQVGALSTTMGSIMTTITTMGVSGLLVWLIPNKPA